MKTKRITSLVIVSIVALSGIVFAATPMQSIQVSPNTAQVIVNGTNLYADNFNYNGNIYIPLRAVSEQMGAQVNWNQSNKTVTITSSSPNKNGISANELEQINACVYLMNKASDLINLEILCEEYAANYNDTSYLNTLKSTGQSIHSQMTSYSQYYHSLGDIYYTTYQSLLNNCNDVNAAIDTMLKFHTGGGSNTSTVALDVLHQIYTSIDTTRETITTHYSDLYSEMIEEIS